MGGVAMSSSKGGRKSLDAALNLVPFIDLLSCCLAFLLITAVWVNLSQVPVRHGSSAPGGDTPPPTVTLTLSITPDAYVLERSTGERTQLAAREGDLDYQGLATAIQAVKRELPEKGDITVRSSDGVVYDRLIKTIDVLRAAQFPDVSVTDNGQPG